MPVKEKSARNVETEGMFFHLIEMIEGWEKEGKPEADLLFVSVKRGSCEYKRHKPSVAVEKTRLDYAELTRAAYGSKQPEQVIYNLAMLKRHSRRLRQIGK